MKKTAAMLICAAFFCGCAPTDVEIEETDISMESLSETETQTTAASVEETVTETSIKIPNIDKNTDSLTIDMNNKVSMEIAGELDEFYSLSAVTVKNCGSKSLDFLEGCGIYQLTLYDFDGRAKDYEQILKSMRLEQLIIYTENYSEEDREIFRECVTEYGQLIYSAEETLTICGYDIPVTDRYLTVDAAELTQSDALKISRLGRIENLTIDNVGETDLSMLEGIENIEGIALSGISGSSSRYIDLLKSLPELKKVRITDSEYSSERASELMLANPDCEVYYCADGDDGFGDYSDKCFFHLRPFVTPKDEEWRNELTLHFVNFTDEVKTAQELRIYHDNGGEWEQVQFANGEYYTAINLEIEPDSSENAIWEENEADSFTLTKELFDYSGMDTGRYKAAAVISGESCEMEFVINNSDCYGGGDSFTDVMDFLDEEQKEVFDKAYEFIDSIEGCDIGISEEYVQSHTTDDYIDEFASALTYDYAYNKLKKNGFINGKGNLVPFSGARGSDITVDGEYFVPISVSDDSVLFKNVVVGWHGDIPFEVWYNEINYHMIKTDEGWKFDVFQIWY